MKILIVDDEEMLLNQLKHAFEKQRYLVETALDGEEALRILDENPVDLIILDIMLPKRDGLSVLEEIRANGLKTPVIMLTARVATQDKVKGLDKGADDYLAKPFSFDELLARIRALFRRANDQHDLILQIGDLQLDPGKREVTKAGVPIQLTAREFSVLEFLLYNKNRAVSRFNLAEHVWGDDFDPFSMSNFMDVHMKNLRKKIGDSGSGAIIRTIRGVGYIISDDTE